VVLTNNTASNWKFLRDGLKMSETLLLTTTIKIMNDWSDFPNWLIKWDKELAIEKRHNLCTAIYKSKN